MLLYSKLNTTIAYDGGAEAKGRGLKHSVTIYPRMNTLNEQDMQILRMDPFFGKHFEKGHFREVQPEAPPAPAPAAPVAAAPVKPVKPPKPGQAQPPAALSEADQKAVADFLALEPAAQDAMLPTLSPEQRAAVEASRAK